MKVYTREEWQQLTIEQRETVAAIEARRSTRKLRRLAQARDYRGRVTVPIAMFLGMLGLFIVRAPVELIVGFTIISLGSLIQFHASGVNRRLDAAVELIESSPEPEPAEPKQEIEPAVRVVRKSRWRCE
jgi:hypothetical protein